MTSTFNILLTAKTAHHIGAGFSLSAYAAAGTASATVMGVTAGDRDVHALATRGAG
jgi:hypothetical protein